VSAHKKSSAPRRAPRASFVITLSASTALVAIAACGGPLDGAGGSGDPITSCPAKSPGRGSACSGTFDCHYCTGDVYTAGQDMRCVGDHFETSGGSCNPPPACPSTKPVLGTACVPGYGFGPMRCTWADTCEDIRGKLDTFTCDGSKWILVDDYVAACPDVAPTEGASCLCGEHHYGECNYDDCYGRPTTTARCDKTTGKWTLLRSTCKPPPPHPGAFEVGPAEAGSGEAGSSDADAGDT
jgi:hypothetical protein